MNDAVRANSTAFDHEHLAGYQAAAPHLRHEPVFDLMLGLMQRAVAACPQAPVRVLDLGAGEGAVTREWLALGANVTAVDLSPAMMDALRVQCAADEDRLTCVSMEVRDFLVGCREQFDILSCISFLHHVPDYLGLLELGLPLLRRPGFVVTFADPLRYQSLPGFDRRFEQLAYAAWRLGRPDVVGGIGRRLRRMRGIYREDSFYDNAEYHVTRGGVDQDAIAALLRGRGMQVEILRYWSTQSPLFQRLGRALRLSSAFAMLAH